MQGPLQQWKSQIITYQQLISKCIQKIAKPLNFIPPCDFNERIENLKTALSNDEQQIEYLDVVLYYIQGHKKKSLIQLSNYLSIQLGRSSQYWQHRINDYAENQFYTQDFSQWQVRKQYTDYMHLAPQTIANLRKFRKITKNYITALRQLIKTIKKVEKESEINKIDESFKKVRSAQQKYYAYMEQTKFIEGANECSNISNQRKQQAKKTLFQFFKLKAANQQDAPANTLPLTEYNFSIGTDRASKPKHNVQISGNRLKSFQQCLKNISKNKVPTQQLKVQFFQCKQQKPHRSSKSQNASINTEKSQLQKNVIYSTIWDSCYFFSYIFHPFSMENIQIDFTNPFKPYKQINYEINSQQEYYDLLGEDINSNGERSNQEQESLSGDSFIVSDQHESDNQSQKEFKVGIQKLTEQPWSIMHGQKIQGVQIKLIEQSSKLPLPINYEQEIDTLQLSEYVHNKSKKMILDGITGLSRPISKAKLDDFLKKNCQAVRKNRRIVYRVIGYEKNELEQQTSDLLNVGQQSNEADISCQQTQEENIKSNRKETRKSSRKSSRSTKKDKVQH